MVLGDRPRHPRRRRRRKRHLRPRRSARTSARAAPRARRGGGTRVAPHVAARPLRGGHPGARGGALERARGVKVEVAPARIGARRAGGRERDRPHARRLRAPHGGAGCPSRAAARLGARRRDPPRAGRLHGRRLVAPRARAARPGGRARVDLPRRLSRGEDRGGPGAADAPQPRRPAARARAGLAPTTSSRSPPPRRRPTPRRPGASAIPPAGCGSTAEATRNERARLLGRAQPARARAARLGGCGRRGTPRLRPRLAAAGARAHADHRRAAFASRLRRRDARAGRRSEGACARCPRPPPAPPCRRATLVASGTLAQGLPGARLTAQDAKRVRVAVDDASWTRLVEWLAAAQSTHRLAVEEATIEALPATGRVRAAIVLAAP